MPTYARLSTGAASSDASPPGYLLPGDSQSVTQKSKLYYEIVNNPQTRLIEIRRWRNDSPRSEGAILIDPAKQYSIISDDFESKGKRPVRQSGKAEMEFIRDAGVWFPREAIYEYWEGTPLAQTMRFRIAFTQTRLNIPISEDTLRVRVPAGVKVTDGFHDASYKTRQEVTFDQIISGEAYKNNKPYRKGELPAQTVKTQIVPPQSPASVAATTGKSYYDYYFYGLLAAVFCGIVAWMYRPGGKEAR